MKFSEEDDEDTNPMTRRIWLLVGILVTFGTGMLVFDVDTEAQTNRAVQRKSKGKRGTPDPKAVQRAVLKYTNKFRRLNGYKPLKQSAQLNRYAQKKAQRQGLQGYLSHGNVSAQLLQQNYYLNGENLACFQGIDWRKYTNDQVGKKIVELYLNDVGHRENMTNPYYQQVGIGVYLTADGQVWNTQDFGTKGDPQKQVDRWFAKLPYNKAMKKYKKLQQKIRKGRTWTKKRPIPSRIEFDGKRHSYRQ